MNEHHKPIINNNIKKNKTLIPSAKVLVQTAKWNEYDAWQGFVKWEISGKSITIYISVTGKTDKIYYRVTEAYSYEIKDRAFCKSC